ncbi:MAG: DUF1223 domain-containing protein [Candidatus Acidiferrum sp.]
MKLILTSLALFATAAVLIIMVASHGRSPKNATPASDTLTKRQPVIVELFTSEGCSSCPPADALLKELSELQPIPGAEIIALEEHVDYWDHLGWKDPYSSFTFTERQTDYSKAFGGDGVYTPQMVVDGESEFVGSRSREARSVIEKAASGPKMLIEIGGAPGAADNTVAFDVRINDLAAFGKGKEFDLWIAITEKGLHTDVKSGENSGESLQHAAIVRALQKEATFGGTNDYQTRANLKIDPAWKRDNLRFVAFAVQKNSRKIVGAAITKL